MHERAHSEQTSDDAKLSLMEWSVEADAELAAQIQDLVAMAKAKTRKAAPWIVGAGAALLMGTLFGRKKKGRSERDGGGEAPRAGNFGAILKVAIALAPHILPLLRKR